MRHIICGHSRTGKSLASVFADRATIFFVEVCVVLSPHTKARHAVEGIILQSQPESQPLYAKCGEVEVIIEWLKGTKRQVSAGQTLYNSRSKDVMFGKFENVG